MTSSIFLILGKIKIPISLSVRFFKSLDEWLRRDTESNPNNKN